MRFSPPASRRRADSTVPMINVVFLLLIFFMISSELTPPPPFEVRPPGAEADGATVGDDTFYVSATGDLAWSDERGEAALAALAMRGDQGPLTVRADAAVPATEIARLLARLSEIGVGEVALATQTGPR